MTLSYYDLEKENRELKLLVKRYEELMEEACTKLENQQKEREAQKAEFKSEVRGIRSEAEKLAIHFSEVKQQRDRLLTENLELRGKLELVDETTN